MVDQSRDEIKHALGVYCGGPHRATKPDRTAVSTGQLGGGPRSREQRSWFQGVYLSVFCSVA